MIRLRGRWLKRAGFREGDAVKVEVAEGRLVLTQPGDPAPQAAALDSLCA